MQLKLLCVFVVLCFIHFTYVDGLKANDTGVCAVTRSVKKTQRRVYIVKYKCGKKICTTRRNKIKDYIVTQNDLLCCKGWTYLSSSDACSPLCSRGCIGGTCTAPDICHCESPATLDQENRNACYLPKCEPQCVNGICTANNTCTCSHGYENVNNTCQPKCDLCRNGQCISPNNCECNEGFIKINGVCSLPVCQPPCIYGICSVNNTCTCLDGYEKVNNTCQAKCDFCENGRCVSPNNCECNAGFLKINGVCSLPVCQPPCIYGICSVNNTCTCLDGYEKVNNTCQPKCEFCQNGLCVSPNNCECFEGYAKSRGVCRRLCVKDVNVTSNVCKCVVGYKNDSDSCYKPCGEDCVVCDLKGNCKRKNDCGGVNNTCQPKCEFCQNGLCVSPNNCECFEGYAKSRGVCRRLCVKDVNVTSNVCKCVVGYKNDSDSCYKPCGEDCVVCDLKGNCKRKNDCGP